MEEPKNPLLTAKATRTAVRGRFCSTAFLIIVLVCAVSFTCGCSSNDSGDDDFAADYDTDDEATDDDTGPPEMFSEEWLRTLLSRAITMSDMCHGVGHLADNIRMLNQTGARFAGRVIFLWGEENILEARLTAGEQCIDQIHSTLPDLILQAAIFEIVTTNVASIPVPDWVFDEFGLPYEDRSFRYEDMLFDSGDEIDFYGPGASVPDMTKLETRMWFFYLASRYMDIGIEAIHLGQFEWMSTYDTDNSLAFDLVTRIRNRAVSRARRGFVLLDAHTHGMAYNGQLLLDFHSNPLLPVEVEGQPLQATLEVGFLWSIYLYSLGGMSPLGWQTASNPYLAEFDHGYSLGSVEQNITPNFVWGYDEITWFSLLSETERNAWLYYGWDWIRQTDPAGYLQMPGMRPIWVNFSDHDQDYYYANQPSPSVPTGYNQEGTIAEIWSEN